MIGFNRRFSPYIKEIKKVIDNYKAQNHLFILVMLDICLKTTGQEMRKLEAED